MSRTVWTVIGVIVAVVAVIVFFVIRALVRPSDEQKSIER